MQNHELNVRCPVCGIEISKEYRYPFGEYNEAWELQNKKKLWMSLMDHMNTSGCVAVRERTPYEKCHKCGEMHLWEGMHMHGENQDVFCKECYEESCYTGDWG